MNSAGTIAGKDVDVLFQRAQRSHKRTKWEGRLRRILAYVLKGIAAGGSLAIASDLVAAGQVRMVGATILVAVAVDAITSNHTRLIAAVKASFAYDAISRNVGHLHNVQVSPLVEMLKEVPEESPEAIEAKAKIDEIELQTHKQLFANLAEIDNFLKEVDIKALQKTSLDNENEYLQRVQDDGV